jgi:hypothetical protein
MYMEYLGGGHAVLRGFENEVFERSKNVRTEYLGVCETYTYTDQSTRAGCHGPRTPKMVYERSINDVVDG